MEKPNIALETSLLPQYQESAAFMERFLVAAHVAGTPIYRSPSNAGVKLVDGSELDIDVLDYFTDNRDKLCAEFEEELSSRIERTDFSEFCTVVATEWFDGKRLREDGRPRRLKRSVFEYLSKTSKASFKPESFVQVSDLPLDVEPLISVEAIAAILTVNDQMIYRHTEEWKRLHPNSETLSSNDIFLRRGLALLDPLDISIPYREWDFINSYSLAFSAPEKFSQMMEGKTPAIVNGELALFTGRVLFFSPFIPGMDVGQLEFGVIPSDEPLPIHFQGCHANILEYILDPPPHQKDVF